MSMIARLGKARVTQGSLAVVVAYWVVVALVPGPVLLELLDGILLAVAVLLLAIYLPLATRELLNDRLDRSGRLLLGIALAWACTIVLRFLAIYGRAFGRLSGFIESPFFGLLLWGMIWAAALHISAPYADRSQPLHYGRWVLFALLAGGLIAGFFLGVQYGAWLTPGGPVVKPMTG